MKEYAVIWSPNAKKLEERIVDEAARDHIMHVIKTSTEIQRAHKRKMTLRALATATLKALDHSVKP